jgi:hypothetical protein
MPKRTRRGGLKRDPAVEQWQRTAAENSATLTAKERRDRARCRAAYDVPPRVRAAVKRIAEEEMTSASQAAMVLLAWAIRAYGAEDEELLNAFYLGREPSDSLRFEYNLELTRDLSEALDDFS